MNAIEASFVHSPSGENVDWRLSARISPSHVTVSYTFPSFSRLTAISLMAVCLS